jgi:cytoskeleton protein RodZ
MASVGAYLRELRTRQGKSLDDLARLTRVAPRYLQALENDAYDELPAPVFIRGFIRAYCQALGESPDDALAHYDSRDGRTPRPVVRSTAAAPARTAEGDPRRRSTIVVSLVLLVVLGVALFTVALVIRPGDRGDRIPVQARPEPRPLPPPAAAPSEPAPARPSAAPVPPPAPAPTAPPVVTPPALARTPAPATPPQSAAPTVSPRPAVVAIPAPPAPAPAAPPTAPAPNLDGLVGSVTSPYRLTARTSDVTWIRVRTDDGRSSEETVPAGEVREWISDRPFVVTVGNAGGVNFELNGRALPPLGPRGVVIPRLVLPPDAR